MGWLAHSARFLYQGHYLLSRLKRLKQAPSLLGWKTFLSKLQDSFVKNDFLRDMGNQQFTVLSDANNQGWGAVLL